MASTWQKYGNFVKVSAGIALVSGGMYIGIVIKGQHMAEINAAAIDRNILAFAIGEPDFSAYTGPDTNKFFISPRLSWTKMYDETMVVARDLLLTDSKVPGSLYSGWLVGELKDGDSLCQVESEWIQPQHLTNENTWVWNLSSPSNFTETVSITSSIIADESFQIMPGYPTNKLAGAGMMSGSWGSTINNSTNGIFGGTNNYWTCIGLGTNVYKYGCEKWHGLGTYPAAIAHVAGSGFTNTPATAQVPQAGGTVPITFTHIGGGYGTAFDAYAYAATAQGLEPAYGVVYTRSGTYPFELDKYLIDIPEQAVQQVAVRMRLKTQPNFYVPVTYTFNDSAGAAVGVVSNTVLTFTYGDYNTWQSVYLTTGANVDGNDRTGVLAFTDRPNELNRYRVPVVVRGSGARPDQPYMKLSAPVQSMAFGNTVNVDLDISDPMTPYMTAAKYVRTNNVIEAIAVLSSLKDTIAVFDTADAPLILSVSNTVYTHNGGNIVDSQAYDDDGGPLVSASDLADMAAACFSLGTYTNYSFGWPSLVSVQVDADAATYESADGEGNFNSGYNSEATVVAATASYDGIQILYPCLYAITNDYVKNIKVYGVIRGEVATQLRFKHFSYETLDSYTLDEKPPNHYENYLFGAALKVAALPPPPDSVTYEVPKANGQMKYNVFQAPSAGRVNMPLSLLANIDCVGLKTNPVFAIAAPELSGLGLELDDYQRMSVRGTVGDSESYSTAEQHRLKFYQHLRIEKIVIVVEWDWKHCSTVPFDPTP